jgi:hypothetical protein
VGAGYVVITALPCSSSFNLVVVCQAISFISYSFLSERCHIQFFLLIDCEKAYGSIPDKIIWESNLNLKDAHKLVIKSKFWQDLLLWYSSLNFNDDSNKVTKTDFIWYNSHLKINDSIL